MSTINNYSPLRYPGGKAAAGNFFEQLLSINNISRDGIYCEPFAGGAGVALTLLLTKRVKYIIINDYDRCISSFWYALLNFSERFIDKIYYCSVSVETWKEHRYIYNNSHLLNLNNDEDIFKLGFSTFFLNRTNRAGILPKAGPIGGKKQSGKYHIDARFKKDVLIKRINNILSYKDKIILFNLDVLDFLEKLQILDFDKNNVFVYLDPPYYKRGHELYLNFFDHNKHIILANYMKNFDYCKWVMTYDDCDEIRNIYLKLNFDIDLFPLRYSMQHVRKTNEIIIYPEITKNIGGDNV